MTGDYVDNGNGSYLVTEKYFKYLQKRELLLDCLEACGVDNWSGFDDGRSMYLAELCSITTQGE